MKSSNSPLFKILPDRVFAPLSSANKDRYWFVLCSLYNHRFGPDAEIPPTYGYQQSEIHKFIESLIQFGDAWVDEDGDSLESSLNIQAINILNRLVDAGWFYIEKGSTFNKPVTMKPAVGQFLSTLMNFAEKGPVFVSGKIRSIANLIDQVERGEGTGDALREAAEQSRNLIQHIQNTSINVRDIVGSLDPNNPTAEYVRGLFHGYIETYFIGDYRDLKTQDHPLAKRRDIIDSLENITSNNEQYLKLENWYRQNLERTYDEPAKDIMNKDLKRLYALNDIETFLERLDEELRRANRKILSVLHFKIRSLRPLDELIESAINNLISIPDTSVPTPFAHSPLMSGARLYEQRVQQDKPKVSPLRKKVVSVRDIAMARLMQRASEARSITSTKLSQYVDMNLSGNATTSNDTLNIQTISDLHAYQALQVAAMAQSSKSITIRRESRILARTFTVTTTGDTELEHKYLSGKPFQITQK